MIFSIWDDHDFGLNDGGGSFVNKSKSEKIYLDFWKYQILIQEEIETNILLKEIKII